MDVGTCVTLLYGKTKQKYILHLFDSFLAFFSTLPSTQTIDYRSNFCSMSWPWKIGLWTCISTIYLFYKAFFLRALHKFRPPFIKLKDVSHVNLTLHSINQGLSNNLRRPQFKELPHRFTKIPFPIQLQEEDIVFRKIYTYYVL